MDDTQKPGASAPIVRTGAGFAATYSKATALDLVRLVKLSGRSAVVTLTGNDGACGQIFLVDGNVVDASFNSKRDVRLVADVMAIDGGQAHVTFDPDVAPVAGRPEKPKILSESTALVLRSDLQDADFPRVAVVPPSNRRRLFFSLLAFAAAVALLWVWVLWSPSGLHVQEGGGVASLPAEHNRAGESELSQLPEVKVAKLEPIRPPAELRLEVVPAEALILLDGELVGTGAAVVAIDEPERSHTVRLQALGYVPKELTFAGTLPPSHHELEPYALEIEEASLSSNAELAQGDFSQEESSEKLRPAEAVGSGRAPRSPRAPRSRRQVAAPAKTASVAPRDEGRVGPVLPRIEIIESLPEVEVIQ